MIVYRAEPAAIVPARHFALEVAVCPKAARPAGLLRIEAVMPEHGHGMAYAGASSSTSATSARWTS